MSGHCGAVHFADGAQDLVGDPAEIAEFLASCLTALTLPVPPRKKLLIDETVGLAPFTTAWQRRLPRPAEKGSAVR